jgi:hypothetical protein
MTRYSAAPVMAGLKDFQRATVNHVMDRFHGADPTRRFLIADETGMGKSVVARGIVAETLQRLQDDTSIDRVDVIYVCSNQDIAKQNLDRLRVTSDENITLSSRLTMLAKHSDALSATAASAARTPINLVAFTPGTSFDRGWRTGKGEERALLFLLLEQANAWDGWRRRAARRALQATIGDGQPDKTISAEFLRLAAAKGLLARFDALLDGVGRRDRLPSELRQCSYDLIGEFRSALAQAGVQTLQPDLIILDEFQRFRHLLDPERGGESAELAHHLFNYPDARVLLLSATPYKAFTFAEEAAAGEDHHADFRDLLRFLCADERWNAEVGDAFESYRQDAVRGHPCADARQTLRRLLLRVMCRTERPTLGSNDAVREVVQSADDISTDDVRSYVALRHIAKAVGAPMTIEYWKSAPYFLNFTDGYLLGDKVKAAIRDGRGDELAPLLDSAQLLSADAVHRHAPIDLGNGRLRRVAADTVERGWWRLLWIPPSMPQYQLQAPFAEAAHDGMTKRLIFSSWNATPNAVAGLLNVEVERHLAGASTSEIGAGDGRRRARLDYRVDDGRPASMSTLALFWPHPGLASACDPLTAARSRPDELLPLATVEASFRPGLLRSASADLRASDHSGDVHPWAAALRWPGADLHSELSDEKALEAMSWGLADGSDTNETSTGLARHIAHALAVATAPRYAVAKDPVDVIDDLIAIGAHGPGNIAWRALGRLLNDDSTVSDFGHWRAAAVIASGLRSTFNRAETMLLLDQLNPDDVYWRAVLRYCAVGGLQATLDEYLHSLRSSTADLPLTDETLYDLAITARNALSVRPSTLQAFDPSTPETPIKLPGRFALRYGGRGDDQAGTHRQSEVRNAFNSPFWPFVVVTTSAGQEGIDFHTWCSAVVHWNTPANPVDFEQREGRVQRFGGHAVRRNVATAHRADALRSNSPDVWKAAYDAARTTSGDLGDFAPYWVYPGPAKVERHVLPYPLSRDLPRLDRLKEDLVFYRLAFGQPRQEDMLALMRRNGVTVDDAVPQILDLRPGPATIW